MSKLYKLAVQDGDFTVNVFVVVHEESLVRDVKGVAPFLSLGMPNGFAESDLSLDDKLELLAKTALEYYCVPKGYQISAPMEAVDRIPQGVERCPIGGYSEPNATYFAVTIYEQR